MDDRVHYKNLRIAAALHTMEFMGRIGPTTSQENAFAELISGSGSQRSRALMKPENKKKHHAEFS